MTDTVIVQPAEPGRRGSRAWVGILILLILAAAAAWFWVSSRPKPVTVVRRDIVGTIPVIGEVVAPPSARADIAAPYRAQVDRVFVSIGSRVNRGDQLVQLLVPNANQYVEQARLAMLTAETAFANGKARADAQVADARVNLTNAQAIESGSRPGSSTVVHPDGSSTTTIPSTGGQPLPERGAAEQALARAESDRAATIGQLQTQLDMARLAYREAQSGKPGLIRAPITGTVLALNAQPAHEVGVDPKIPVATIVRLQDLVAQAPLDAKLSVFVKPEMPVDLRFADIPGEPMDGKVSRITSAVTEKLGGLVKDQKFVALIEFDNRNLEAKPGMKPIIQMKTGEAKNATVVPAEAVDVQNGGPVVKVMRDGKWTQVAIETGVSDGRFTQVKSGVRPGEVVQVTPNVLNAGSLPKP